MPLSVVGISHKTAHLDIRELFQFHPEDLPRALNHFCAHTQSAEVLILSTCNRVEIYSDAPSKEAVIDWFHTYHEQAQSYHDHFYAFDELDALRHAIRVGAGIDSLVMGEPEILGQLKDAKRTAMQAGCIGVSLEMFMNHAVNAAKQIRHHTAIGHCPISVAYSAIQICKTAVTPHTQILVLGAGDTVKKLLQHLPSCAKAHVTVMNRSFERAQDLAHAFQVKAAEWADLPKHLHQAGIILSAIHTETPIIRADSFTTREHPLLILDLSVPRSIHPDVESLPMTRLIAIDDIDAYIAENTSQRRGEAERAAPFIETALNRYLAEVEARQAIPTIVALRESAEHLIQQELARALHKLQTGHEPAEVMHEFAHKLKQKWLHTPSKTLHTAAARGERQILDFAKTLFDL